MVDKTRGANSRNETNQREAPNLRQIREDAAAGLPVVPTPADPEDFKEPEIGGPAEGQGPMQQGVPFSIDQVFAAFGAAQFENQVLRMELQKSTQQVTTLKNVIKGLEKALGK